MAQGILRSTFHQTLWKWAELPSLHIEIVSNDLAHVNSEACLGWFPWILCCFAPLAVSWHEAISTLSGRWAKCADWCENGNGSIILTQHLSGPKRSQGLFSDTYCCSIENVDIAKPNKYPNGILVPWSKSVFDVTEFDGLFVWFVPEVLVKKLVAGLLQF